MFYTRDLAEILAGVTKASQPSVETVQDGIRVYMIDYVRRGCSMKSTFCAYVDLIRFAEDIAHFDNGGKPMLLTNVTRNVIEAHLARLANGEEIKCIKKPSAHTVERRRRVVKAFISGRCQ